MAARFQQTWERLRATPDDFIRTTEPRHVRAVQTLLGNLWEKGEIYQGDYESWYCLPDERFWTEKDLNDGLCPDCGRSVERIVEPNYFFWMSAHQNWLIDYIMDHPSFIRPPVRRNEVLGFLRRPLSELCISRPTSRLSWGIPLPFDPSYVTYVWFDALINYLTGADYLVNDEWFANMWPGATHLIGKDILVTHSVYWPTRPRALGLPQPSLIFAQGWWVIGGTKMSKSLGNVVKPLDLANVYGADAFRYFLMRDMAWGRDAEFSEDGLRQRYLGDLSNDLGNLLHRVANMVQRYTDGRIPRPGEDTGLERALRNRCLDVIPTVLGQVESMALNVALGEIISTVGEINRYLERTAPWKLSKTEQPARVATILYHAAEAVRLMLVLLHPVMPTKMAEAWRCLGWHPPASMDVELSWGRLVPGSPVKPGPPLFPREMPTSLGKQGVEDRGDH